jgi:hypothetical protein
MKIALLLVLPLLATGCGGSSGDGGAKKAYLAKAEAICAKANAQLAQAKKEQPTAIPAVPPYVHRLVNIARDDVNALSALTPPSKDASALQAKVLQPLREQLKEADDYAKKVDAAAARKDPAALTQLVFNPPTTTRADIAWMKTYGFKACAKAADTGGSTK